MLSKMVRSVFSVLMFMFLFSSCEKVEMKAPPPIKPYPAPALTLSDLAGKDITLASFKGKPVVVNFWATWCIPCRNEMPELEKLHRERKSEGLEVLLVNVKESKEVVEKYISENGFTFKVFLDTDGDIYRAFQVFGLPSTFFIDSKGIVRYSYMGELTWGITKMGLKSIGVIKPNPVKS
jgi:thiol-disulfide isomerase/thioredoxin